MLKAQWRSQTHKADGQKDKRISYSVEDKNFYPE